MQGGDAKCLGGGGETPVLSPFLDVFLPFLIIFLALPGGDRPLSPPLDPPLAKGHGDIASLEIWSGVAVEV